MPIDKDYKDYYAVVTGSNGVQIGRIQKEGIEWITGWRYYWLRFKFWLTTKLGMQP